MNSSTTHKDTETDIDAPNGAKRDFAWEAELIAEARAAAAAGQTVSQEQVDAWLDSWGTDHELTRPRPAG